MSFHTSSSTQSFLCLQAKLQFRMPQIIAPISMIPKKNGRHGEVISIIMCLPTLKMKLTNAAIMFAPSFAPSCSPGQPMGGHNVDNDKIKGDEGVASCSPHTKNLSLHHWICKHLPRKPS